MTDHHDFKLVDTGIRRSYAESELTTTNVRSEIAVALAALESFSQPDIPIDGQVEALAAAYNALLHLDRWLPRVPDAFVCGYFWGGHLVPPEDERGHFSSFSAHATREEAELWLPYWRKQIPGRGQEGTKWVVEQRPAAIYDFVRGGPPA